MKTNLYTVNAAPNALRRPIGLFLGLVALIVFATTAVNVASASIVYPTNNGFEQPNCGSGFQYFPSSPGWTFTTGTNPHFGDGIAANGSNFNLAGATNGNNDNGATSTAGQAAFLQAGDGTLASGYFSQTLTLPGGSAVLFLSLEGRMGPSGGVNGVNVFLNGVQVGGTLFPANLGSFNNVSVNLGNLTAGSYTIAFAGDDPIPGADRTTFVDNVTLQIGSVPDGGSTVCLLGLASLGLVALRRKLRC